MDVNEFLEYVMQNKITNIMEIKINKISESTIRRRLKELEKLGYINILKKGNFEVVQNNVISIEDTYKENINKEIKNKIAKKAAEKIQKEEIIFIDNGTTVRHIFKYIKPDYKNIIYTNGYKHIDYMNKKNIFLDIRIIPGKIKMHEASIVGEEAILFIDNIYFDKVFIGANGIKDNIITTPNEDEKNLKLAAINNSNEAYILLDSSKKGKKFKHKLVSEGEVNIITD